MVTIIFIGLLGVFSYHCLAIHKEFGGSSVVAKAIIGLAGMIGDVIYYITLVWSFWCFPWWQPIVVFVSATLIGSVSAFFFQRNIIGTLLSPILVIVFSVLSVIGLI
ncbi:MAG: hypothetical protein RSA66_08550 [Muribaculaceae bacterium]